MAQNNIAQKLVKDQDDHEDVELSSVMALTEIPEVEETVIGYCGRGINSSMALKLPKKPCIAFRIC